MLFKYIKKSFKKVAGLTLSIYLILSVFVVSRAETYEWTNRLYDSNGLYIPEKTREYDGIRYFRRTGRPNYESVGEHYFPEGN